MMGYSIAIGERKDYDDGGWWVVGRDDVPGAPLDSCSFKEDYDGRSNGCCPGYGAWRAFCERADITDVWFGQNGPYYKSLDRSVPITKWTLDRIDEAMEGVGKLDVYDQRRLKWMHWWMHWAVKNCKSPVYG